MRFRDADVIVQRDLLGDKLVVDAYHVQVRFVHTIN